MIYDFFISFEDNGYIGFVDLARYLFDKIFNFFCLGMRKLFPDVIIHKFKLGSTALLCNFGWDWVLSYWNGIVIRKVLEMVNVIWRERFTWKDADWYFWVGFLVVWLLIKDWRSNVLYVLQGWVLWGGTIWRECKTLWTFGCYYKIIGKNNKYS